jgi:hypothetical protein
MRVGPTALLAWWLFWSVAASSSGMQGPFATREGCEKISEAWPDYLAKRTALRDMPKFECVSDK